MNPTAEPLKLQPIRLESITRGGYRIHYTGKPPVGTRLLLGIPDVKSTVDVTHRAATDLLGVELLPKFLSCIGRLALWGTTTTCTLFAVNGNTVVAQSPPESFATPVRPYAGKLGPSLGAPDSGPPLQYTGIQTGRTLHVPAIDGCYYYSWAGHFETDNKMRGLNCITYAGAVFGVPSITGAMSQTGTHLATHLRTIPCGLEAKTGHEIKAHFSKHPHGTYLMWGSDHVVVVVNSFVHEFSHSKGGYMKTSIHHWHFGGHWSVRKTPIQF